MRANVFARSEQIQSLVSTISAAFAAAFERAPEETRVGGLNALLDVDLDGVDGAILRALRGLSRFDAAIVAAAALPSGNPNGARASAIEFLAAFAMPSSLSRRIDAVLARHLIGRHFGGRISYKELGAVHDLDPSNVRRRACAVSEALMVEERATWERVASCLRDAIAVRSSSRFSMEV
ncbi:hypothetical protein [Burkholderia cenocepacia]|uniref:hypothetical protein n=1 Tax=Burkholderia cenocepacia TaxID=95486 RepID=UPI002856B914|nr:hypothetical protein [Burkholderia cenocepacia]MDR8049755.1 hypothetical protein [Burkholderia cenocepacia]